MICPATADDCALLARLHRACFAKAWGEAEFASFFERDGIVALLADPLRHPVGGEAAAQDPVRCGAPAFGRPQHDEAKGFIFCWNVGGEVELLAIGVHPDHCGRGLGAALLAEAIARCKAQGARVVHLEVGIRNEAAQRLYERHGFEVNGRRKGYYHHADGSIEDALTMRLDI